MPHSDFVWRLVASVILSIVASACGGTSPRGEVPTHALIGRSAPEFEVITLNSARGEGGRLTSLALLSKSGVDATPSAAIAEPKIVVVSFWAAWSPASQRTLPKLAELAEKYRGRIVIIGISVDDDPARLSEFAETFGVRYPIAWDDGRNIVRRWYVPDLPAAFVLDRERIVRAAFIGYGAGLEVEIENAVKRLL